MLKALKRYREHLNLSPLPNLSDRSPLLPKYKGTGGITSTRHVRLIVQNCFDATYDRMLKDGLEQEADDLKIATVHWLRHTGISEDVKHRPREHVRDDAGHASMATTDRYIESDARERHQTGKYKKVKDT
jgi:integrase